MNHLHLLEDPEISIDATDLPSVRSDSVDINSVDGLETHDFGQQPGRQHTTGENDNLETAQRLERGRERHGGYRAHVTYQREVGRYFNLLGGSRRSSACLLLSSIHTCLTWGSTQPRTGSSQTRLDRSLWPHQSSYVPVLSRGGWQSSSRSGISRGPPAQLRRKSQTPFCRWCSRPALC